MIAAACRIFPRGYRPTSSLTPSNRRSASSLTRLERTQAAALRRSFSSLGRDATAIERPDCCYTHHRHRHQHEHAHAPRWLSTTPSDHTNPPVEVTVTNSTAEENSSDQQSSSPSPGPNVSKSTDQEAEEEILSLQSELRAHHRHAAYDTALGTASHLLELTSSHFGKLHPATASAYNNVGLMNKLLGNYGDAKDAYHDSLRIYGEVCGKDHASYAAALSNVGMLERGRVLESEAAENNPNEDDDGNNEDGVELGELRDNNKEEKMSAMERMQLNESAIEYFDEAYRIRLSELGHNHPHTITSRSQLGSAMAAAVTAERKGRIGGLVEAELRKLKQSRGVQDAKEMEAHVPEAIARAAAKSSSGSKLTRRRWAAAEEHLRGALATAVDNPRGESIGPLMFIPIGGTAGSDDAVHKVEERQGLTLPLKKDRSLSKKDRKRSEKERKREKRLANANALQSNNSDGGADASTMRGGKMAVQGVASKVTTLSAATAAQNLAVFLKNYSDFMRLTLMDDNEAQQKVSEMRRLNETIEEARHLYESTLHVRSSILPPHHPEVVATKFSLAELLDAPKVAASTTKALPKDTSLGEDNDAVDSERANELREEILNAYNVEEREDGSGVAN